MASRSRRPLTLYKEAFATKTLKAYQHGANSFLLWCKRNRENPRTVKELDRALAEYIQFIYDEGLPKTRAALAIAGIQLKIPRTQGRLHLAHLQKRGLYRALPRRQHPPVTREVAIAIALRMALDGHYTYGLAVLLSFDCFLRIGEVTSIKRNMVHLPGESKLGTNYDKIGIALPKTKTGVNQFVTVQDPDIAQLFRDLVILIRPKDYVFTFSPQQLRQKFHLTCARLGLSERLVPHSLRHGGATHWHLVLKKPIADIMMRGRWKSQLSAEGYIQSGPALLMSVETPLDVAKIGAAAAQNLFLFFSKAVFKSRKENRFLKAKGRWDYITL